MKNVIREIESEVMATLYSVVREGLSYKMSPEWPEEREIMGQKVSRRKAFHTSEWWVQKS